MRVFLLLHAFWLGAAKSCIREIDSSRLRSMIPSRDPVPGRHKHDKSVNSQGMDLITGTVACEYDKGSYFHPEHWPSCHEIGRLGCCKGCRSCADST